MTLLPPLLWLGCAEPTEPDPTVPVDVPYRHIRSDFATTDDFFEGEIVTHYVPEHPRAVVFPLHGTDGGIDTVTQVEWIELYNLLSAQDVAVVLTESRDREHRIWQSEPVDITVNPDFLWLSHLRDHLIETTALEPETPVMAIGFSNGANFSVNLAVMALEAGWDFRSFSAHQGSKYTPSPVPGLFVSAENDETGATGAAYAEASVRCEDASGGPCPTLIGTEALLEPMWFTRLVPFDAEESRFAFDELVDMGIVDADGRRTIALEDMDAVFGEYLQTSASPNRGWVPTQVRVVWATHRFSSQHVQQEAAYLLDRL